MTPSPPPTLVDHLRDKRCVLFCGSGVSASAGLPTWKTLLTHIVEQLAGPVRDDANQEELRRLIDSGKLLEVADHCKEALGPPYYDILSEQLRGVRETVPEIHRIITKLPFASVVTTNYDKLLERAYATVGNWPRTPTHRDLDTLGPLLFNGGFFILKAHGDIDRPDSLVLTTRDYQEIIHANPSFNAFFSALLLTKAVLFVGYSLNDPDFRLLMDRQLTVFKGHVPARYALMTGLGKVECEVLWRTAQIKVIPYDEGHHEQVQEFLSSLLRQVGGGETDPTPAAVPEVAVRRGTPKTAAEDAPPPREPTEPALPEQPACVLSIGLRGTAIEASLEQSGRSEQSVGGELNRRGLTALMREALRGEESARRFGQELARRLPDTISRALSQIPKGRTISLRLTGEIDLLPWELTAIDGDFLLLRNPLVRMPGVSNAARGYPNLRGTVRVLLIGNPNRDDNPSLKEGALPPLEGAEREIKAIANLYKGHERFETRILIGPEATFDTVASDLTSGKFDIIHFAGHAWFDELEPFLLLSKQVKLRATAMRTLLGVRPPAILFLNTHYSIFLPPGASGELPPGVIQDLSEPSVDSKTVVQGQRGFIEAAGTAGVGTLIGSYSGNLDDITAEHVGVSFHREFLSGKPVAEALHDALSHEFMSADARENDERRGSCLTYAMSGYGDLRLSSA